MPRVPKDYELFLNLTEFAKHLLPSVRPHSFGRWMYVFCKHVIALSHKFPHVSGFYKLLSVAVGVAEQLSFFRGMSPDDFGDPASSAADAERPNATHCYVLLSKFVREVRSPTVAATAGWGSAPRAECGACAAAACAACTRSWFASSCSRRSCSPPACSCCSHSHPS